MEQASPSDRKLFNNAAQELVAYERRVSSRNFLQLIRLAAQNSSCSSLVALQALAILNRCPPNRLHILLRNTSMTEPSARCQ